MRKILPPRIGAPGVLAAFLGLATIGALLAVFRPSSVTPGAQAPDPGRADGHWDAVARGRRFLGRGRPDLALGAVMQIRDDRPGSGEAMGVAGFALSRLGDPVGARAAFERALHLQPDQPEVARALAALCLQNGDVTRGLVALERLASSVPGAAAPLVEMGRVHLDLGEFSQAADSFRKALGRAPDDVEARRLLIVALLNDNRPEEAGPELESTLGRAPEDPQLLGLASRHALLLGQRDEAIALANRALDADPEEDEALLARGRARAEAGDPEGALADLERFIAIRPNNLAALQLLAQVESRLGLTERASRTAERHRAAYDRADRMARLAEEIAQRPDDPALQVEMGRLALAGGSTELARRCFLAALRLDPTNIDALEALDQIGPDPGPPAGGGRP